MANRTLHSAGSIAFVDYTNSRQLTAHIASNLPTTQIYDVNNRTYSPDWSTTNLNLSISVFLDAQNITNQTGVSIVWYKRIGTGSETQISTNSTLTISTNEMSNNNTIITYTCVVTYQDITASDKLTFTRVDTGANGSSGNAAPAVLAQYSVDGVNQWSSTLNSTTHKYIRLSYDNGVTWTSAIKIAGNDGTSVNIKGTAYYNGALSNYDIGRTVTLYTTSALTTQVPTSDLNDEDSYIVQGYLCVYSQTDNKFRCTGQIQGPKGNDGISSYTYIRYATDINGSNMSISPNNMTHLGVAISTSDQAPSSPGAYVWTKFVGESAKSIVLSADSQIFKVDKEEIISPQTISITAQTFNTSINTWIYSTDGGSTFSNSLPNGVTRSGNVVTVSGSLLDSDNLTVKASDGTYGDTFTVYRVFDGIDGESGTPGVSAALAFLTNENISFSANAQGQISVMSFTTNVVAYRGAEKVLPVVGSISNLPDGMSFSGSSTVGNEVILSFSIANNATLGSAANINGSITVPISEPIITNLKLNWNKINSGAVGNGINSVTVTYGSSSSVSAQPTEWQSTIPDVEDGNYLWTRTIIDYTDSSVNDTVTYSYVKQGSQGIQGNPGSSVTVSSVKYQSGDFATVAPTGTWSDNVVAVEDGKYLWSKTTFSDNTITYGVAKQGVGGTPASLVNITPSALYFKSTTGKGGTFTPEYIYLYPRFQTVSYSGWQYSVNGGSSWVNAAGTNGISIDTYNSVANSLRISRSSTLYTDSVTSISFRCNSNNASIYDIVSIAKIYDVVDIDTGWITLNTEIKYRKKNGWVCVVGQCSGSKILTQNDYTTVGKLPVGYRPNIQIPFIFNSDGSSTGGISSYVSYDGDIQMYTTESGKNYWMFSVTFPI